MRTIKDIVRDLESIGVNLLYPDERKISTGDIDQVVDRVMVPEATITVIPLGVAKRAGG